MFSVTAGTCSIIIVAHHFREIQPPGSPGWRLPPAPQDRKPPFDQGRHGHTQQRCQCYEFGFLCGLRICRETGRDEPNFPPMSMGGISQNTRDLGVELSRIPDKMVKFMISDGYWDDSIALWGIQNIRQTFLKPVWFMALETVTVYVSMCYSCCNVSLPKGRWTFQHTHRIYSGPNDGTHSHNFPIQLGFWNDFVWESPGAHR